MRLNCNDWTLEFQVNKNGFSRVFEECGIEKSLYSARIGLCHCNGRQFDYELISFQNFYWLHWIVVFVFVSEFFAFLVFDWRGYTVLQCQSFVVGFDLLMYLYGMWFVITDCLFLVSLDQDQIIFWVGFFLKWIIIPWRWFMFMNYIIIESFDL